LLREAGLELPRAEPGCSLTGQWIVAVATTYYRTSIGEKAASQPGSLIIASWRRPDPERIWLRVCNAAVARISAKKIMGNANSWMNKNNMWFVDDLDKKQLPKENIL